VFLNALYSFLLISSKLWMVGEGEGRSAVMLLNRTGGLVWALKPPFKVTRGLLYIKPLALVMDAARIKSITHGAV
jgi:hypothetical protein